MRAILLVCVALLLQGCFGTSGDARFFLLDDSGPPEAAPQGTAKIVEVRSVELPKYLDRSGLVVRNGPSEVRVKEFDLWAEPLADNIRRSLALNLAQHLGPRGFLVTTWESDDRRAKAVTVQMLRFDCSAAGECTLAAQWSAQSEGAGAGTPFSFNRTVPISELTSGAEVAGLSSLVRELAMEIASRIAPS